MDNPLKFSDKDGRDAVISIVPNKDNTGDTITVSAKVFINGNMSIPSAGAAMRNNNDLLKTVYKDGTYKDNQGRIWAVRFDVQASYHTEGKTSETLGEGENILQLYNNVNRSFVTGSNDANRHWHKNYRKVSTSQNGTIVVVHEIGHLLGLDDRYTDTQNSKGEIVSVAQDGYQNDIMGSEGSNGLNLVQSHYDSFGGLIVGKYNQDGSTKHNITGIIDRGNPQKTKNNEVGNAENNTGSANSREQIFSLLNYWLSQNPDIIVTQ